MKKELRTLFCIITYCFFCMLAFLPKANAELMLKQITNPKELTMIVTQNGVSSTIQPYTVQPANYDMSTPIYIRYDVHTVNDINMVESYIIVNTKQLFEGKNIVIVKFVSKLGLVPNIDCYAVQGNNLAEDVGFFKNVGVNPYSLHFTVNGITTPGSTYILKTLLQQDPSQRDKFTQKCYQIAIEYPFPS